MTVYVDSAQHQVGRRKRRPVAERFWEKVDIGGHDECWPWTGSTNGKRGYGTFRTGDKRDYAHRFALELHTGVRLLPGEESLHRCDNPPCCNPSHLFKGTAADNIADMMKKGRHRARRGEGHRSAKLNEQIVRDVRKSTLSNTELAEIHGVRQNTISNIRTRKTWRHIQ